MIELSYMAVDEEDGSTKSFGSVELLIDFVLGLPSGRNVYMYSPGASRISFVHDSPIILARFIGAFSQYIFKEREGTAILIEFPSYQEAVENVLVLNEENQLCFAADNEDDIL